MVYLKLEKTDFEILDFMARNLEAEHSIKEISEILKRPYVKIHKSIKRLEAKKIINIEIKGKSHYCLLDYGNNLDVLCFICSQRARNFLEKNKKIKTFILEVKEKAGLPDYIFLIFGSFAKGNADKNSDLDIAIISSLDNKEAFERLINSLKRIYPIKIHSLEFDYKEFIEMLKAKENNVGKEIIKNNIIFSGAEQFYNCLLMAK